MKYIFLFLLFSFSLQSQVTIECIQNEVVTDNLNNANTKILFNGLKVKEGNRTWYMHNPVVTNNGSLITIQDAYKKNYQTIVSRINTYNTVTKLYDYLTDCNAVSGGVTSIDLTYESDTLIINIDGLESNKINIQQPKTGIDVDFISRKKIAVWNPIPNSITPSTFGFISPTTTGFTATTRTVATTNLFTRSKRVGYVTGSTVGQVGQFRCASAYTVGDATTNQGGFTYIITFGISDVTSVTDARMFIGLRDLVLPTNVEPSTLTNCIGIGHGAADTNMKLFYGGTSAQTPIDLGVNFPITHGSVNVYELRLYSASNSGNVEYRVTRLNTGHTASGIIENTGSTVLPTNTTLINTWGYRTNNATGASVAIDVMNIYIETDY